MKTHNKKTILISSYHSLISRNILQSGIPNLLVDAGVRIVVVCHAGQRDYVQELIGDRAEVIVVDYPERRRDRLVQLISMALVTNYNLFMRRIWQEGQYAKVIGMQVIYCIASPFALFKRMLRRLYRVCGSTNAVGTVFKQYMPDLVFSTDLFNGDDVKLLNEAKQKGVATVGMVRSWDNPTTRGILLSVPEKVLCWNEIIKEELISIHGLIENTVVVTGIPHHDKIGSSSHTQREMFLKHLGLDPAKKTILVAPGGKMQYRCDGEILRLLKRLKDNDRFIYPVQFLVRQQPGDRMVMNGLDLSTDPDFVIDTPGKALSGKKKENEISKRDDDSLISSIRYSDIALTLVSSVILDATYYDKPGIIFHFDPQEDLLDTPRKFVRYKHIRKLFDSGLLTIARSEKEFVEQANRYLSDPTADHDKRMALSKKYAYKLDGHSSERVVKALLEQLDLV